MKRKFVKISFIVAMAMIGGINLFNAQKSIELSDIAMANVEALAQYEAGSDMCSTFYGFAKSAKIDGFYQIYTHWENNLDRVTTYNEIGCIATGEGTLWGTPGVSTEYPTDWSLVLCTGICKRPQL
jgi:hypothetical protein